MTINQRRGLPEFHTITLRSYSEKRAASLVRNMRIAVADMLRWLAAGQTNEEILGDFPELTEDNISACLPYAARRLD
jgi:Protein of unknown function (DUF433)